jgi:hypothetical protein
MPSAYALGGRARLAGGCPVARLKRVSPRSPNQAQIRDRNQPCQRCASAGAYGPHRSGPALTGWWDRDQCPFGGEQLGHRELETFWNEFWSTFEEVQVETHGFTEAGSEVVTSNTAHMLGRDRVEVIARSTFLYTVENGQITRLRMFQERAEALEAVGLSEQDAHADS